MFFVTLEQFGTIALLQVMQIPNLKPVFLRDQANKMYSPTAYYFAGWLSSTMLAAFYPVMSGMFSFHFLALADSSNENFMRWISILMVSALQGSSFGFMIGCISENIIAGINWLQYTTMVFLFGSGIFINLKEGNTLVKIMGYCSPFRYTIEPMLRSLLSGLPYGDRICVGYDFTFRAKAVPIAIAVAGGLFVLGWIAIVVKSRRM